MKERRRSPRADKALSIKLSDVDFDILTETTNVSASGTYCPVNKPLPLMTKIGVVLLIPIKKNKTKTIRKVTCSGVVVRLEHTNKNAKYPYQAAIYFNNIKDPDKKALRSYVNTHTKD